MDINKENYHNMIDAYLRNEISAEDKALFEQSLRQDPELLKEFKIHKELYAQLDENDWIESDFVSEDPAVKNIEKYYQSEEVSELKKVITKAQANYKKKENKKFSNRDKFIVLIAAASVVLFIVLYSLNSSNSTLELYAQYSNWEDLPSLTSRSDSGVLSDGQSLFEEEKYQQSYTFFRTIKDPKKEISPAVLIYFGLSCLELNKYDEAIHNFDQLINSDTVDHSKGYWYKALVYLKQDKKDDAIVVLETLTTNKNNYNYQEAIKLLEKLR